MSSPGDDPLVGTKNDEGIPQATPLEKPSGEDLASTLSKKRKREVDSLANGEKENEKIEKLGDSKPETEGDEVGGPQGKKAKVGDEVEDATSKEDQPVDQNAVNATQATVNSTIQFADLIEPLQELRTCLQSGSAAIGSMLSLIPQKVGTAASTPPPATPAAQLPGVAWGKLIALKPKNLTPVPLTGASFSIGGNNRCNLTLLDPGLGNSTLCKIHRSKYGEFIETLSSRCIVLVNGRNVKKGTRYSINNGDNIKLVAKQIYSFRYQKNDGPASRWPPPTASGAITLPPPFGEGSREAAEAFSPFTMPVTVLAAQRLGNPSASPQKGQTPTDEGPAPSTTAAATSAASNANMSSSAVANHLARRYMLQKSASGLSQKRKEHFKEEFAKRILRSEDNSTTFDNIPYFVAKDVKEMLINSAYIFLKKPEYAKFTADLPTVSRRILLVGPPGSEMYQERLVRALAKYMQASLLVYDAGKPEVFVLDKVEKEKIEAAVKGGKAGEKPEQEKKEETKEEPEKEKGKEKEVQQSDNVVSGNEKQETESGEGAQKEKEQATPPAEGEIFIMKEEATIRLGDSMDVEIDADEGEARGDEGDDDGEDEEEEEDVDSDEGWHEPVFKKGDRVKFVGPSPQPTGPLSAYLPRRGPHVGDKGIVIQARADGYQRKVGVRFERVGSSGGMTGYPGAEESRGYFVDAAHLRHEVEPAETSERAYLDALFEFLTAEQNVPCVLFVKDADRLASTNYERYASFKKRLEQLSAPVVVIGSSIVSAKGKEKNQAGGFLVSKSGGGQATLFDFALFDHISRLEERARESNKSSRVLSKLFPSKISIKAPTDSKLLNEWTKRIAKDQRRMKFQQNKAAILKVLDKNGIKVEDKIHCRMLKQQVFSAEKIEKIVGWAISYQVIEDEKATKQSRTENDKLVISTKAIEYGIEMLDTVQPQVARPGLKDVVTENDFERKLLAEAIPPNELNVQFDDIGALDKVKATLMELVMLPLQRPELFRKGNLRKPCKGILLFGPPGTGKTMLAKAVATESGANFLNCSMSAIGSKWFGEGEKYARAIFTLASKIAPCVIFIDEVDSILGSREKAGEHEAMRKIKNEFMSMWDGLKTQENERVIVLAATNRPFDLDDAVLRRMPRRLLVDLPDAANREKILRVILENEDLEDNFNYHALAEITEGFSGSDLKNLCISAAYRPIREIIAKEKAQKIGQEGGAAATEKPAEQDKEKGKEKEDKKEKEEEKEEEEKAKVTAMDTTGDNNKEKEKEKETEKEKEKEKEKVKDKMMEDEGYDSSDDEGGDDKDHPFIRALKLEDFICAKKENSASVHEDAHAISELRRWNEMYGEGGSMRGKGLTYFI